jgi:hypothetical protein
MIVHPFLFVRPFKDFLKGFQPVKGFAVSNHSWFYATAPPVDSTTHPSEQPKLELFITVSDFGVSLFVEIRGC